ncbi:right-handed parallel beta-helix repeat-containing protein [Microbacterium sp. DT81.1]|uniref:right-handed parallel beta-helix repeat-containing protein n=1 Tax=Microbacterium sp. DT81.1 TaxID=3393413 RepID=UPI003CEE44AE
MRRPGADRKTALALTALLILGGVTQAGPASAATIVGPATYEESSSATVYTGSWASLESGGSSGGAIRYADGKASATLTFRGSSITWYTWNSTSGGIVDVYLDDVRQKRVDNYSGTRTTKIRAFTADGLNGDIHTIRIAGTGLSNANSSGTITHHDSFVVGRKTSPPAVRSLPIRIEDCPAATVRVHTASELTNALTAARPGTVIHLAAGTYRGGFALTASGTATAPIWVCGPRTAVVQGDSEFSGTAMRLGTASHARVTGFTVTNALAGVMVKYGNDVAITDLHVRDTGNEGIHLYGHTTDSFVVGNLVERTGLVNRPYGEGIYIGTSGRRWAEVTNGQPDRSDRNTVALNTVKATGAEAIEAKEGTSDGSILHNTVIGHSSGSNANAWIMVTGNDWYISGNSGQNAVKHGYASFVSSDGNWGYRNIFRDNSGSGTPGTGLWIQSPSSGSQVSCDNWVDAAAGGVTNVFCAP